MNSTGTRTELPPSVRITKRSSSPVVVHLRLPAAVDLGLRRRGRLALGTATRSPFGRARADQSVPATAATSAVPAGSEAALEFVIDGARITGRVVAAAAVDDLRGSHHERRIFCRAVQRRSTIVGTSCSPSRTRSAALRASSRLG
jgi:hypothetical protein